jgi:hypothetical protein
MTGDTYILSCDFDTLRKAVRAATVQERLARLRAGRVWNRLWDREYALDRNEPWLRVRELPEWERAKARLGAAQSQRIALECMLQRFEEDWRRSTRTEAGSGECDCGHGIEHDEECTLHPMHASEGQL